MHYITKWLFNLGLTILTAVTFTHKLVIYLQVYR